MATFFLPSFSLSSLPLNPKSKRSLGLRIFDHQSPCLSFCKSEAKTVYTTDQPKTGAKIIVEALKRQGVEKVFAYPGGASLAIHHALKDSSTISTVLPRHEQGGVFAAEGFARSTEKPGVCLTTSGPGATNLVTGLQNAMLDSIPLVAITGQLPLKLIGTGAFQDTPVVELTRPITKYNYLVTDVEDIPQIMKEAFFVATSGRPRPVLVDIPKDIQQQTTIPNWEQSMRLPTLPKPPNDSHLEKIVKLISECKKLVLYVGGGCLNSSDELSRFVELTGIPVASTFMGLGCYPLNEELSLHMLGMHDTVYANYTVEYSDLLLAFGVRFDDRVTGKLEAFASRDKIVHIDIDPAEIGKNKKPDISICGDVKLALHGMNTFIENSELKLDFGVWRSELNKRKQKYPLSFKTFGEAIPPQYAIQVLDELTEGKAIITTGAGKHQMWAAQFYNYKTLRQWISSGGLGAMGFGLPAAIGASIGNPNAIVVDIDGDGSFIMNIKELATIKAQNLPVKILLLNNQHMGMIVQWEEWLFQSMDVRGDSFLGDPVKEEEIFPNMLLFAAACAIPAARVTTREHLREAIRKMLLTTRPYLLEVMIPVDAVVLPMIPYGCTFEDTIT